MQVNKKANFWFGVTLFIWSSFWADEILLLIFSSHLTGVLRIFTSFIQFLAPLFFYISILFFTNPHYTFKKRDLSYIALPLLYLITIILDVQLEQDLNALLIGLIIVHLLLHISQSYVKLQQHQKQTIAFSSSAPEVNLKWLEYIIIVILCLCIVLIFFNIIYYKLPLNLFMNGVMLLSILFITYNVLKQQEIFPIKERHRLAIISLNDSNQTSPSKRALFNDQELVVHKNSLSTLMKEEALYLDCTLNLASLAEQMHLNSHQLSYVINNGFNENFFQFVNRYRVKKAKELLVGKKREKLSILGIAFEAGFSSKTSFNTIFKKMAGCTPSEFVKQHSNL